VKSGYRGGPEAMEIKKPEAAGKQEVKRHPSWLKVRAPLGENVHNLKKILAGQGLNTVCQEARCPNLGNAGGTGLPL